MLGIHVLKTCAQRELTEVSQTETHSFMILLGELLGDVFDLMQTALKVLFAAVLILILLTFLRNQMACFDSFPSPELFKPGICQCD
jgi:hypothetical protein